MLLHQQCAWAGSIEAVRTCSLRTLSSNFDVWGVFKKHSDSKVVISAVKVTLPMTARQPWLSETLTLSRQCMAACINYMRQVPDQASCCCSNQLTLMALFSARAEESHQRGLVRASSRCSSNTLLLLDPNKWPLDSRSLRAQGLWQKCAQPLRQQTCQHQNGTEHTAQVLLSSMHVRLLVWQSTTKSYTCMQLKSNEQSQYIALLICRCQHRPFPEQPRC